MTDKPRAIKLKWTLGNLSIIRHPSNWIEISRDVGDQHPDKLVMPLDETKQLLELLQTKGVLAKRKGGDE